MKINDTENSISSLICDSCGSTDFKKITRGEYVCRYCGKRFLIDQNDAPVTDPEKESELIRIFNEAAGYERKDQYEKELQTLSKGLKIAPDDCTLLTKLGRVYWRLGFLNRAREYLDKAQDLYPDDPVVYNNIALLYLSKNMYEEARPYFEKSIRLVEDDPLSAGYNDTAVIYGNYALCIGLLGEMEEARKYLKIAKKKGYPESSIKNVCKKLKITSWNI
ncbi:MAG: tetratricopeptide repeat protein [Erysipelotrichaceae bacterium]|nr:tetratricopeptide repeat protein [Erysipelotrichaceae bacterium]